MVTTGGEPSTVTARTNPSHAAGSASTARSRWPSTRPAVWSPAYRTARTATTVAASTATAEADQRAPSGAACGRRGAPARRYPKCRRARVRPRSATGGSAHVYRTPPFGSPDCTSSAHSPERGLAGVRPRSPLSSGRRPGKGGGGHHDGRRVPRRYRARERRDPAARGGRGRGGRAGRSRSRDSADDPAGGAADPCRRSVGVPGPAGPRAVAGLDCRPGTDQPAQADPQPAPLAARTAARRRRRWGSGPVERRTGGVGRRRRVP